MAGTRPRGERPRRNGVERELDRQDLGWGGFWTSQVFVVPPLFLAFWGSFWLLDRSGGAGDAARSAVGLVVVVITSGAVSLVWQRRIVRAVFAAVGDGAETPSDAGRASSRRWRWPAAPAPRDAARTVVLRDLAVVAVISGLVGVPALVTGLAADVGPGALRSVVLPAAAGGVVVCVAAQAVRVVLLHRGRS